MTRAEGQDPTTPARGRRNAGPRAPRRSADIRCSGGRLTGFATGKRRASTFKARIDSLPVRRVLAGPAAAGQQGCVAAGLGRSGHTQSSHVYGSGQPAARRVPTRTAAAAAGLGRRATTRARDPPRQPLGRLGWVRTQNHRTGRGPGPGPRPIGAARCGAARRRPRRFRRGEKGCNLKASGQLPPC